ncbi:bifunctional metallophosphatase/5'-nucleotidase [Marinobacter sp. ATCH36]|uniref:bifunctional metallophosphatase/5'-nucleotidase n=1 Tax=Marinobacter sp. ATCH36 TaxID=2945106 RepID=UPI0020219CDE|nr:bifunctional metallophosphatase/5'-nucleotidase [Marinobacter sp. ATCH36]MCL7942431.1 bifunctional metallophosphatase/5'-nucleotidase [Marinobacter sp. ATCH36]
MRSILITAGISGTLLLAGCNSSDNDSPETEQDDRFTLQLLHLADVDGGGTAAMFNVDEFSALVDHFRSEMPDNTVVASSGDNYIPGPIFQASQDTRMDAVVGAAGEGRGETQIQNRMGIQVSAVGNHDLDTGPSGFAGIISADGNYPGALYPYISANVDFTADPDTASLVEDGGQEASDIPGRIAPSAVITVDGERIGFVGAVTPTLPQITSTGTLEVLPSDYTRDDAGLETLAASLQPEIDALLDDGINKIVLLSHMQVLDIERGLATRLEGVDIIVGGGSNTLLADANDTLRDGDSAQGDYPEIFTSPADEPVLLVNTDADYKYLGRLLVDFDDQGRVITDSIDPATSGAYAAIDAVVDPLMTAPIAGVVEVADVIREILGELDGSAFGITEVFLDGRREFVRSRETNLGNLSADANLWYGQVMVGTDNPPVISVKNGGGIRAPIGQIVSPAGSTSADDVQLLPPESNEFGKPQGGISQLDIQTAFAFNNGLALVNMTAAELHDLVEEMIKGNFTHTGGLRVEFDPEANARSDGDENLGLGTDGKRVLKLEVLVDPDAADEADRWDLVVENGTLVGEPSRSFRVIALDFLASCAEVTDGSANCGSGWPFNGLTDPRYVELADPDLAENDPGLTDFSNTGGEQDAFSEYLKVFHPDAANAYNVPVDVNERLIPVNP